MNITKHFYADSPNAVRCFDNFDSNNVQKFVTDSNRVFQSKEFRRLNGKTQVFVTGFDDNVRNRLTHTLEVNQISQTISRNLHLNSSLIEAIALSHDVGHTPFGHVGERTLNLFMNGCGDYKDFNKIENRYRGFKHNFQGIRVVSFLERISKTFPGLDLTNYTMWGILNHTGTNPKPCGFCGENQKCNLHLRNEFCSNKNSQLNFNFYDKYLTQFSSGKSWTIEALIVRMADEIAQRHHDMEDGLYAGIIDKDEIIEIITSYFKDAFDENELNQISEMQKEQETDLFINKVSRFIIEFFIKHLISETRSNLNEIARKYCIKKMTDFEVSKSNIYNENNIFEIVGYNQSLSIKEQKFHSFLETRILNSHIAQSMDGKADFILRNLIEAYISNPQQLPNGTILKFYQRYLPKFEKDKLKELSHKSLNGHVRDMLKKDHNEVASDRYKGVLIRTICDFIAGMTDNFAIHQYNILYGTSNVFSNFAFSI